MINFKEGLRLVGTIPASHNELISVLLRHGYTLFVNSQDVYLIDVYFGNNVA